MTKDQVSFEQVIGRGCGLDVHKKVIVATIKGKGLLEETRSFASFTSSIEQLRDWLKENKISHVAMESTGVYWKPVFNILEEDFEILLVNARHIKNVPGHKTDKKDSSWIAKLLLSGLLKGSFIPPKPIRELRDLCRYRRKVVSEIANDKNRIHRQLEDANIKLSSVLSDLSGATATRMIDSIISGERDIKKLVSYRHGKVRASESELAAALKGKISDHHCYMLKMLKKSISSKEAIVSELDEKIDEYLREQMIQPDSELLQTIPGVGKDAAASIMAEIGTNMSQFPSEHHLASWAGMSPGSNESAGKKKVVASPMATTISRFC